MDLTELITFNVLEPQRADGLATIMRQAELHELRVDSVEERPRRLSVNIHVTVTGERRPPRVLLHCDRWDTRARPAATRAPVDRRDHRRRADVLAVMPDPAGVSI